MPSLHETRTPLPATDRTLVFQQLSRPRSFPGADQGQPFGNGSRRFHPPARNLAARVARPASRSLDSRSAREDRSKAPRQLARAVHRLPARLGHALALLVLLAGLAAGLPARAAGGGQEPPPAADGPRVVVAGRAEGPIRIDGKLDEPDWQRAGVIPDLVQQEPHPGEPTPYHTEVRVLVDERNLYFGIVCRDPEPGRIAIHTMQRDGNMWGDDTVMIVLSTLGDRRRGYAFRVNAAGARLDGLISGPEDFSTDWDGIWDARARITPDGWVAEIRIPAQTLRFTPGADAWEFNVERYVSRDRTTLRWAGTSLDSFINDFRRAGRLAGVGGLRQGRGLSISPYGLVRYHRVRGADDEATQGDGGLDVTWNVTPEMTAVFTVNTDFAETEVDTRQVNLTRFPLFFPEKRAFFLEGSNLFGFGAGLGADFIPFFSRRVGLYRGHQVPIDAGLKLLGQAGRWGVALLDVQTGDAPGAEATNLFAGRVTYDVDEHLTVGAISTNGDPDGVHDNALYGADVSWQTSTFRGDKNFSVGAWTATTRGDVPEGDRSGWGLKVDYPNDLWDVFFIYKQFGEAMDPALGFLPRPGTRWFQGGGAYQPRPPDGSLFDWVRQFYFEFYVTVVKDLHGSGDTQSWRVFTAPFNAATEGGEHLEANWVPQYERIDEPFEIAPGVVIPPGEYHMTRYRVEAQSSRHRPARVGATIWFGEFYDGHLTQYEGFVTWTDPRGHLSLSLEGETDVGHLPWGNFIQRLWQLKAVWAFTPDVVLSSYFQYDSESRNLGMNTRLRWTIRPGNDLYVVWNRDWLRPFDEDAGRDVGAFAFRPLDDQVVVKLRWTFRP